MDHGYYKDRISGYLDAQLPDYEMEAVRLHLEECTECRGLYEKLVRLDAVVERHSRIDGEDYWEAAALRIEQRIGITEEPKITPIAPTRSRGLGWKLAAVAASVAVLAFIGINYTDIMQQGETPAPLKEQEIPAAVAPSETPDETSPHPTTAADEELSTMTQREAEAPAEGSGRAGQTERESRQAVSKATEPTRDDKLEAAATEKAEVVPEPILDKAVTDAPVQTPPEPPASEPSSSEPAEVKTEVRQEKETVRGKLDRPTEQTAKSLSPTRLQRPDTASPAIEELAEMAPPPPAPPGPKNFATATAEGTTVMTIADWELRRDSLQTRWEELRSESQSLGLQSAKTARKQSNRLALSDTDLIERQLLEAQYRIATLATEADSVARERAVEFLTTYLELTDARHRTTAQAYLDELHADEPDSGAMKKDRR